MNVFEFLGKSSDFRTEKKVVQLVKHFDDVNPKASEGILHKKVNFPMFGQVKSDGVFCMVVVTKEGCRAVFNRTGKQMTNCEQIVDHLSFFGIRAGVYIGELVSKSCSLEQLSGVVNPNRKAGLDEFQEEIKDKLSIDFFDYLTICEFISGLSSKSYSERHTALHYLLPIDLPNYSRILSYDLIIGESDLRGFADKHIMLGEEGAVFKQNVEWKAGAKDWHQMKIVRGISYDLECIGFEEGTGKYEGKVANLIFRWKDGKTIKCMLGKGWTHNDAEGMFQAITNDLDTGKPIGSIFEVYALQESSKGKLRLPKVGELRHDKVSADF